MSPCFTPQSPNRVFALSCAWPQVGRIDVGEDSTLSDSKHLAVLVTVYVVFGYSQLKNPDFGRPEILAASYADMKIWFKPLGRSWPIPKAGWTAKRASSAIIQQIIYPSVLSHLWRMQQTQASIKGRACAYMPPILRDAYAIPLTLDRLPTQQLYEELSIWEQVLELQESLRYPRLSSWDLRRLPYSYDLARRGRGAILPVSGRLSLKGGRNRSGGKGTPCKPFQLHHISAVTAEGGW